MRKAWQQLLTFGLFAFAGPGCQRSLVTWSPNGRTAAVTVGEDSYLIDYNHSTSTRLPGRIDASAWSADGKDLYYATPKLPPVASELATPGEAATEPSLPDLDVVTVMTDGRLRELFELPWPVMKLWMSPDDAWLVAIASDSPAGGVVAADTATTRPAVSIPAKIYGWNTKLNRLFPLGNAGDVEPAFCNSAQIVVARIQTPAPDQQPDGAIIEEISIPAEAPVTQPAARELARLAALPMVLQSTGNDVLAIAVRLPAAGDPMFDLYRIRRPSGSIGVIARDVGTALACSPDGQRALYLQASRHSETKSVAYEFVLLDLSGVEPTRRVAQIDPRDAFSLSPAWRTNQEFTVARQHHDDPPTRQWDLVLFRIDKSGEPREVGPISHFDAPAVASPRLWIQGLPR